MFYDFRCHACGFQFEKEKRMTDPSNEACPKCGKESFRVITGGAGILTRSGRGGGMEGPCPAGGAPCDPGACGMGHHCGMADQG